MVVTFMDFVEGWIRRIFGVESQLASAFENASVVTFFTFLPSFIYIFMEGPFVEITTETPEFRKFTNAGSDLLRS